MLEVRSLRKTTLAAHLINVILTFTSLIKTSCVSRIVDNVIELVKYCPAYIESL